MLVFIAYRLNFVTVPNQHQTCGNEAALETKQKSRLSDQHV